jgi:hypothetical protein
MRHSEPDWPKTLDEFRAWHERQPEVWEFIDGVPKLMAPGSMAHTLITQIRSEAESSRAEARQSGHLLITSTIMLAIAGAGVCDCNQEIQSLNEAVTPGGDRREHRRHWATRDP